MKGGKGIGRLCSVPEQKLATLQRRSYLCIPRNETARPRSQFPHCSTIGGPIVEIYKSLTDKWMWKLGMRPRSFFSGNIFFFNFDDLPGTLFIYFFNFLSTELIQYSSLVMGWYACCCAGISCCWAGKNLLRYFSAPGFSWAEPREGRRAGFEPGTAVQQPDALTT